MKLEDLERDILGAYLNYENNDLKTTVKQLDMSANSLLKDDKTLDPVWTNISKNVYIAVILNNFSKGIEFSLKDLENMLNNQNIVYSNIIEFCNKFENSEEISFATSLKKISENPLKSAIQILKENIERLTNIKENNNNPNTIKCFCGNEIQVDWSKIPNTEKIIYLKCPKCDSELKRGNPFYVDKVTSTNLEVVKGMFINIEDIESLKVYSYTYTNIYGADPNRYAPIDNVIIPEAVAADWIINNTAFEILSEKVTIMHGNNHDEEHYIEKLEYKTNFKYSLSFSTVRFICKKDNKEFTLVPSNEWITINNESYNIPVIEIYNYNPELLGLINTKDLKTTM